MTFSLLFLDTDLRMASDSQFRGTWFPITLPAFRTASLRDWSIARVRFRSLPAATGRAVLQTAPGMLGIAIVTVTCFFTHLNYQIPSLLYLLVVILQSLRGGYGAATFVSVVAAVCLEYFFIPPVLEWQINDPEDALALVTYLVTSLIITRLALSARSQARIAESRGKDAAMLYETASRLLSLEPGVAAAVPALRVFREVFSLNAACLFDGTTASLQTDGDSRHALFEQTRNAYVRGRDYRDPIAHMHIRCLYSAGKLAGAVGFEGRFDEENAVLPLFALAATSFERTLSFRSASKSAAAAQAEILRSAILDAFAHEFKTPQAVIMAAAGSLREAGGLRPEQLEMTDVIESEISRMNHLTTRLLRLARIDRDEIRPALERTRLDKLLTHLVDQYRVYSGGHPVTLEIRSGAQDVLADPELISLALVQLLDNACKYSTPDSPVAVELNGDEEFGNISVTNEGRPIKDEERERVFERFYRGVETEHSSGAGLGLYVARKIVRAHSGHLELNRSLANAGASTSGTTAGGTTTFRIRLPLIPMEPQNG